MKLLLLVLLTFCFSNFASASECYAVVTNIPRTPMVCEAVYSTPNCTVNCVSSTCTRGFDYNVHCEITANYSSECPVCEVLTVTKCPDDCTVDCEPLITSWGKCGLPRGVAVRPPEYETFCEEVPCSPATRILQQITILFATFLL